jgi:hypothetical protein
LLTTGIKKEPVGRCLVSQPMQKVRNAHVETEGGDIERGGEPGDLAGSDA